MTGNWLRAWQVFTFPFLSIVPLSGSPHITFSRNVMGSGGSRQERHLSQLSHLLHLSPLLHLSQLSQPLQFSHVLHLSHLLHLSRLWKLWQLWHFGLWCLLSSPWPLNWFILLGQTGWPSSSQISKVTLVTFASIVRTFVVLSPVRRGKLSGLLIRC